MAPLLLMVFHLFTISLMTNISLLVSLDLQSSNYYYYHRKINPTSSDRYPPKYQLHYITSMIKLNGTLNKIYNIPNYYHLLHKYYYYITNNNIKLLLHTIYHIIHTTKIILVMVNMQLHYNINEERRRIFITLLYNGIIQIKHTYTFKNIYTNNTINIIRIFIIWCINIMFIKNNTN